MFSVLKQRMLWHIPVEVYSYTLKSLLSEPDICPDKCSNLKLSFKGLHRSLAKQDNLLKC